MEKKYKGDKKYENIYAMHKYVQKFNIKIFIFVCHTLEKIEKGDLFPKTVENIITNKVNENNDKNTENIMFVDGENHHFNETKQHMQ